MKRLYVGKQKTAANRSEVILARKKRVGQWLLVVVILLGFLLGSIQW